MANRASSFAQQFGEDFLTCQVCLNQYRNPKSLPCLHTFCRDCIERCANEQARRQGGQLATITCPTCRAVNPWEGADSLRNSFFVTSLLDLFGESKIEVIKCNVCHDEGKSKEATGRCVDCGGDSLCDACSAAHRRTRLAREHVVVPIDYAQEAAANQLQRMQIQGSTRSTQQQQQHGPAKATAENTRSQTSVKTVDVDDTTEMCKIHRGQQITTVCLDCKTMLCVICLQDQLRQKDKQNVHVSHQIFSIHQSKSEIRKEIEDIRENIGANIERLSEQLDDAKEYEEKLKEKNKAVIAEMKDYNNRLCQLLKKMSGELEKDIAKIEREETQKINARKKHLETVTNKLRDVQQQSSVQLDESKGISSMLEQLNKCAKLKGQADELMDKQLPLSHTSDIVFVPGIDLEDSAKEAERMKIIMPLVGKIKREEKENAATLGRHSDSISSIPDAALSSALTVDIVEKRAVQGANVSALTMGSNGEFIFVDSKTGDILVFAETFKLLNKIKNLREPIDVDILPDGNIAVTEGRKGHCVSVVSLSGQILASEIAKKDLTMATAIGVCGSEGLVVVSDEETCKVHVIRLENGKTETLLFRQGTRNQFVKLNYVACSPDGSRLAVSDKGAHSVKVFNPKTGQFIFKYGIYGSGPRQLNKPADVCFDGEGRLFVCDTGNSRVHVISPDNKLIGHISPKHFKKFEPPPKLIALRKDGCLVLANGEGWVKVIQYKFN